MQDFLALTLQGEQPTTREGKQNNFSWRWLGEGLLECTPNAQYDKAVVLSAGVHGNETAPIELLSHLCTDLFAGRLNLAVRLLLVLGNPYAMRQGKRYVHDDVNRMFCGGYKTLGVSEESKRAEVLEQVVTNFFQKVQVMLNAITMIYTQQFVLHCYQRLLYFHIKRMAMMLI